MLFNSIHFLIFFPVITVVYFLIPAKKRYIWLLLASYYFYMCWNAKYALLLFFSTCVTYLSGWLMEYVQRRLAAHPVRAVKYKKWCVAGCFSLNLSILFLFKYFDFVVRNINVALEKCNLTLITPSFDVILPVGVSFYIFQALSYTMDVYREEIKAEKNFLRYALFVSFFPQLVAGPIERSKNLLSQLREEHVFNFENMRAGLLIMLWGYFQKLVLADRIAIVVDQIYGHPRAYPGGYLLAASVLFAIQIYCDFSGYSMIAIGAAKVMGFRLMENFNCPYLARSVSGFWKRWHISLTSWFRDYLYIPLGGNRKGTFRKYINMMIVFMVSGLWHGAAWTYIVWGLLNGLFQVAGIVTRKFRDRIYAKIGLHTASIGHCCLRTIVTFIFIDITWIFFRAKSVGQACYIIKSILTVRNERIFFDGSLYTLGLNQKQFWMMLLAIGILFVGDILKECKVSVQEVIISQDLWCRWLVYICSAIFILVFGIWGAGYDAQAFVYFQF